jgi:hypothetical protein
VLIAQELGNDGNLEIFPLVGKDRRPEQKQPQNRSDTTYEPANSEGYLGEDTREDAKNNLSDPDKDVQGKRLNRVEFNKRSFLLIFNKKHDKRNNKDRVAKGSPEFIIAGYIRIHFVPPEILIG